MRLTLKAINDELARRGYTARLAKSTGYFYFLVGEASSWLDRTVNVPTLDSLTLQEWITEFEVLRKFKGKAIRGHCTGRPTIVQRATLALPCPRIVILAQNQLLPQPLKCRPQGFLVRAGC